MKSWIDSILNSDKRAALPIMTHPGIEHLGKTVRDAITDGRVHYEAVKVLTEMYPAAAATTIMDLTVEAEAFGASVKISDTEIPTVTGRLVCDAASVEALKVPTLEAGRIPQYLLANRLAAENITNRVVLAGCIGPFSLAGRLYDMSEIMTAIYIEPDVIQLLLEKCTQFITEYCKALKAAGTGGVVMAEPAAGLLSGDDCMMFATPYLKRIIDEVQDDSFTVVLHNCGNTGQCTEAMVATGARALHFGNKIDMTLAMTQVPSDVLAIGNIDPVTVFRQASAEQVKATTKELLEKTRQYRNFVVSSGCDLPPRVPAANVEAFFEAVAEFNA